VASFATTGSTRDFLQRRRNRVNALRLLANCGERSDGTVIADFLAIETVSMTRTTLAFTHNPSVCAETCRARASVPAA
jgi:hypothetical protein